MGERNKKEPTSAALGAESDVGQNRNEVGTPFLPPLYQRNVNMSSPTLNLLQERTRKMLERLKSMLAAIEEAVQYSELQDLAYTDHHMQLCRQRRILRKAVRRMERLQKSDT